LTKGCQIDIFSSLIMHFFLVYDRACKLFCAETLSIALINNTSQVMDNLWKIGPKQVHKIVLVFSIDVKTQTLNVSND